MSKNNKHTFEINIQEPYFTYIERGIKTIEGRLYKSKFRELKIRDSLYINNLLLVEVTEIKLYKSFNEMLSHEDIQKVIPGVKNKEEAENVYRKFYPKEDERTFGVIAIKIKLLS